MESVEIVACRLLWNGGGRVCVKSVGWLCGFDGFSMSCDVCLGRRSYSTLHCVLKGEFPERLPLDRRDKPKSDGDGRSGRGGGTNSWCTSRRAYSASHL